MLTKNKIIYPKMRVLKMEGIHIDPLLIQDVWDDGEYVYLQVRNIKAGRVIELVEILDRRNL